MSNTSEDIVRYAEASNEAQEPVEPGDVEEADEDVRLQTELLASGEQQRETVVEEKVAPEGGGLHQMTGAFEEVNPISEAEPPAVYEEPEREPVIDEDGAVRVDEVDSAGPLFEVDADEDADEEGDEEGDAEDGEGDAEDGDADGEDGDADGEGDAEDGEGEEGPPPKSALKGEWVDYAAGLGYDRDECEALTKEELIAQFGGD